jgi:UDP-glucose:(heptosyl)LPS alpha-1,3-glucosyltransferase
MKIAIIRQKYNPYGGAEIFINRLITSLIENNVTMIVISDTWNNNTSLSQNIVWLQSRAMGRSRFARLNSFKKNTEQILNSNKFDLIQSHERLLGADIYRVGDGIHKSWIKKLANESNFLKKIWLRIDPYHQSILKAEKAMAADQKLTFVANSPMVMQELQDIYKIDIQRIELIENGIDLNKFQPPSQDEKRIKKISLNLIESKPTIGYIGSGFARKGAFQLMKALSFSEDLQGIFIGKDKHISSLKNLSNKLNLKNRVLITGPQDDVRSYLQAIDILCLPSMYDSCPNVVLEAMAMGIPVVITKDVGIHAIIEKYGAGLICTRQPISIFEKINLAIKNYENMKISAIKTSKEFDIEIAKKKWLTLYKKLLDQKNAHLTH